MNNIDPHNVNMSDLHILRAQKCLDEWAREINMVGMMYATREYARDLTLQMLESRIVAECLVDFLAREFRKIEKERDEQQNKSNRSKS
jgi:hypothetical protein